MSLRYVHETESLQTFGLDQILPNYVGDRDALEAKPESFSGTSLGEPIQIQATVHGKTIVV